MEDLKGRRVSAGSPGSATEVYAIRVLEAAGLDHEKDIKKERLGVAESVNAIKDKKIEAFFWVGGLPTAAVTDLAATPNTKIKVIDIAHYTKKMNDKYGPLYAEATIAAATYKGMDKDAKNNTVWNIMAVNASMSDDLAYKLTKIMLEKREDLALVHKEALNIKPEWQTSSRAGIPWHPGRAEVFCREGHEGGVALPTLQSTVTHREGATLVVAPFVSSCKGAPARDAPTRLDGAGVAGVTCRQPLV